MEIKEIGRMLYQLRTKRGISQEELCQGICSVATLSRFEAGERRPDIFVFHALFQRVGKSTDYINVMLTIEEFDYFVKRRNIGLLISKGEFEQAEQEIKQLEVEGNLYQQDVYFLYALLYLSKKQGMKVKLYVEKALKETSLDIHYLKETLSSVIMQSYFSETEIDLILLYIYIEECIGIEEFSLLECMISYISFHVTDEKLKNKKLAIALYLKALLYKKRFLWQECCDCCEEVIDAEIKNGTIVVLFQALKMEVECFGYDVIVKKKLRTVEVRKKQYESLKFVLENYKESGRSGDFILPFPGILREKSLVEEVIHYARLRNGYSQEQLSEGICTPETLSRIETGKRNPTIKHFYAFMKKLNIKFGYYNTEFVVENFETLEKISELKRHSIYKRWGIVEQLIKEIEAEIDMNHIINQQEIGLFHTIVDCHFHRITTKEAMEQIESLLKLSVEEVDGKFVFPCFPTSVEIALFNQISVFYRNRNQQQDAINILMPIYEYFHQGKLEAPEYNQRYFMVLTNLACYLEEIGELEKSMELIKEEIKIGINYNVAQRIAANLIEIGYIEERMGKENYLETYEKSYYLSELFGDFVNQKKLILHLDEIGKTIEKKT